MQENGFWVCPGCLLARLLCGLRRDFHGHSRLRSAIILPVIHRAGGNMKIILFAIVLLLAACDGSSAPAPKIAKPQREALEKARGVDQTLQQANEETQKKISEAEEK